MKMNIEDIFAKRHSCYEINNRTELKEEDITEIILKMLKLYPSSFNQQESRLLLLYRKEHKNFWYLVKQELLKTAPKDKANAIETRINSFENGFGTILYFIDTDSVKTQEKKMPLYASNFKNWAIQGNAMLQYMIWTALANHNIGASLQHYNPLIDEEVHKTYNIPQNWELMAQMPFGSIEHEPQSHLALDVEQKIRVLK